MPDVVPLECPECGARLNPTAGADTVRCTYCGTTSRIADLARPTTPASATAPRIPPRQARLVALLAAGGVVMLGAVGAGIAFFAASAPGPSAPSGHAAVAAAIAHARARELVQWDALAPSQLARIPDGRTILLGLTRHLQHGKTRIVAQAFDARSLEPLWKSKPLGLWSDYQVIHARIAAGKAILTDDHGRVVVDDLTTGHPVASKFLEDRAKVLCVPDPARPLAWILTADGKGHAFDVDTHAVTDAPKPAACAEGCFGRPVWAVQNPKCRHLDEAPKVEGLKVTDLVRDGASEVALGHRAQGTQVPMAAGFDTGTGKLRWQRTLPDGDAYSAKVGQTIGVSAAGDGAVYFVLDMKEGPSRILALDEATGRTRWAVPMPRKTDFADEGDLSFAGGRLYFAHMVALDVLDARTGKLVGTLGEL